MQGRHAQPATSEVALLYRSWGDAATGEVGLASSSSHRRPADPGQRTTTPALPGAGEDAEERLVLDRLLRGPEQLGAAAGRSEAARSLGCQRAAYVHALLPFRSKTDKFLLPPHVRGVLLQACSTGKIGHKYHTVQKYINAPVV